MQDEYVDMQHDHARKLHSVQNCKNIKYCPQVPSKRLDATYLCRHAIDLSGHERCSVLKSNIYMSLFFFGLKCHTCIGLNMTHE